MSESSAATVEATPVSLELEQGGRRFPAEWGSAKTSRTNRVQRLVEQKQPLPALLERTLWERLAWSELTTDEQDRETLVQTYIRSLNQLDEFRGDVENLVREACLANLEFRQESGETHTGARDAALDAKLEEVVAQAGCDWLPTKNILDGRVVAQSEPTLRRKLEESLQSSVHEFAAGFVELLARMVDRQSFGLVEWLPNHCCNYHFFKHVIIQENQGPSVEVHESFHEEFDELDPETFQQEIGRRTTTTIDGKGTHQHRLARHEHSVMNAVRTSIGNSRVIMPPAVKRLLEQIPAWLYPFVEVIDGDICRERIIERDLKVESWEDAVVRDEPIYGWEPGVIIGPYVLTGWGPREVEAEQNRREQVQIADTQDRTIQIAERRAPWCAGAAAILTVTALGLLMTALRGHGGGLFSVLATAAALATAWQAVFDFQTAQQRGNPLLAAHWLTGSIGCQILIAEWLMMRLYWDLSLLTPVALGVGAFVCYAIGRRFQ